MLKILGEKHPLYDFMVTFSVRCSYLLFNKEYVKEILSQAVAESGGDPKFVSSCMSLLPVTWICYFFRFWFSMRDRLKSFLMHSWWVYFVIHEVVIALSQGAKLLRESQHDGIYVSNITGCAVHNPPCIVKNLLHPPRNFMNPKLC